MNNLFDGKDPDRSAATLLAPAHSQKYRDPESLYQACLAYFEWCGNHPIYSRTSTYDRATGMFVEDFEPRVRPFTLQGLCLHAGVSVQTWKKWKDDERRAAIHPVMEWAEMAIYEQKYTHAAVGLFNANIVIRDLGLTDRQDLTTGGEKIDRGTTIDMEALTHDERVALLRAVRKGSRAEEQEDDLLK